MKSRKAATTWLIVGGILPGGPVWGKLAFLISVIRSFLAFGNGDHAGVGTGRLGVYILTAGLVAFPVGLVLTILAAFKLSRIAKLEKGTADIGGGK
jgi:hypothetical protein